GFANGRSRASAPDSGSLTESPIGPPGTGSPPRKTKTFPFTFATRSPHGKSSVAPGNERANSRSAREIRRRPADPVFGRRRTGGFRGRFRVMSEPLSPPGIYFSRAAVSMDVTQEVFLKSRSGIGLVLSLAIAAAANGA